jgi:hypothetical protein
MRGRQTLPAHTQERSVVNLAVAAIFSPDSFVYYFFVSFTEEREPAYAPEFALRARVREKMISPSLPPSDVQ